MTRSSLALLCTLILCACGGESAEPSAPPAPPAPAPEPSAAPAVEAASTPAPESYACFSVINVAYAGAERAPEGVERSETQARERAEALLAAIEAGGSFAQTARTESDARTSAARDGLVGTYSREDWPEFLAPIRDAVFTLRVGETSQVLQAPFGWVIARRCEAELVHTRHILVRYAGARNAGAEITRSRTDAHALASEILAAANADGADFPTLARERSEDSSAERGGDMGYVGRGRFEPEYEAAAFPLAVGDVAGPVETAFGFHVIQRVP